eukprot:10954607-Ditylum_brightwellii.AAC.1
MTMTALSKEARKQLSCIIKLDVILIKETSQGSTLEAENSSDTSEEEENDDDKTHKDGNNFCLRAWNGDTLLMHCRH